MERVSDTQLQAAHDGLDSTAYKELLAKRKSERPVDTQAALGGCLIRECGRNGFNSATPSECPVMNCSVRFNSNNLSLNNEASCQDPSQQSVR